MVYASPVEQLTVMVDVVGYVANVVDGTTVPNAIAVVLTVQAVTTVAFTAKVVVAVFAANAEVDVRPSARNPTTAVDSAVLSVLEHFIESTPGKTCF
jgi:hypothetical protein